MEGLNGNVQFRAYSCATQADPDLHAYFLLQSENWSPVGALAQLYLIHDTDPSKNKICLNANVDRDEHSYSIYTGSTGWHFPRGGTKEITQEEFLTATTGVVWK